MRRRANQGLGQFSGNPMPPQDLGQQARNGLGLGSLIGEPARRVARQSATVGTRTMTAGSGPSPQAFVKQAANANATPATVPPFSNKPRGRGTFRGTPKDIRG